MSKKREKEHLMVQKEGKIRDNYTCQICGQIENIQGHHIFDYQYNGAANIYNIVSLCDECHRKVHSGKIDISIF